MSKRIALTATIFAVAAGLAVQAATAQPRKPVKRTSSQMLVGINDEANTLYGNPAQAFTELKTVFAHIG